MEIQHLTEAYEIYKKWHGAMYETKFEENIRRIYPCLIEIARKKTTITYEGVCKNCYVGRSHIGRLVGAVSVCELLDGNPPISAVVVNKRSNTPGYDFLGLKGTPIELKRSDFSDNKPLHTDKEKEYWKEILNKVYDKWKEK